ncbi:hypothetical protein OS493_018112 [Desmophyllum pertusum]|uniref:Uncharacterized protein n=1 Tax=Desmophyllum pertusum TaxID=174260 RepID=A0A9X0CKI4_9CNID|nr:hypothetical protein OS493_018112 [Desmophyllum pertusum]
MLSGADANLGRDTGRIQPKEFGLLASAPDVDFSKSDDDRNVALSGPNVSMPSTHAAANVPGLSLDEETSDVGPHTPNLDISTRKPNAGIDADVPNIKAPEGKASDVSTGKIRDNKVKFETPSSQMDLPSSKKKGGKCISCAGTADKDEPYRKAQRNAGFDFNGPDVDGSIPSGDINAGVSGPSIDTSGTDISMSRPNVGIDANAPDIDAPDGKMTTKLSGPDVDVSTGKMRGPKARVDAPSAELDLPSTKKKHGNCFSCAGDGEKGEPYKTAKRNVGYDFSGPDGSLEIENDSRLRATRPDVKTQDVSIPSGNINADVSGPSIDTSDTADISMSRPMVGIDANSPDIKVPDEKMTTKLSGPDVDPDVDVSTGKMRGPKARVDAPSAELDLPSTKKKHGNCFSCAGDGEKDEPYRTTKRNVGYDFSGPGGSLEMKKVDKIDISGSGPDFEASGKNKELEFGATGPNFDVHGPNKGISSGTPEIGVNARSPILKHQTSLCHREEPIWAFLGHPLIKT